MEQRSSFVGRADDLAELLDLLTTRPLVTIIGVGGVGKTRLALRAAATAAPEFPDGVRIVELAGVDPDDPNDPNHPDDPNNNVAEAVGSALGYGSFEAATGDLCDAATLLVLDNCEHLAEPMAEVTETLLKRCRSVRILTTSRVALELPEEHLYPLRPLPPEDGVALLRDRADGAGVRFEDGADDGLTALIARLDGLPLAIELAASRLRSLGPEDIVRALDESGRVLRARRSTGDGRHGSVDAAIAWSYDLLTESEARALRAMAVFEASFTADQAHAVIGAEERAGSATIETVDLIDRLVAHSLLSPNLTEGRTTYHLLDLIRRFARERLAESGEQDAVEHRYVEASMAGAKDIMIRARDRWSRDLIQSVLALATDLLPAVRICLRNDEGPKRAFRLFLPSFGIVHYQQAAEFAATGSRMLERWADPDVPGWADTAALTATAYLRIADLGAATRWAEAALEARPGLMAEPVAHRVIGLADAYRGRWESGAAALALAAEAAERLNLSPYVAEIQGWQALVLGNAGRVDEAVELAARTRVWSAEAGFVPVYPLATAHEAYLQLDRDPARATELADEAIDRVDPGLSNWIPQRVRGVMAMRAGDPATAARWLRDSIDASRRGGDLPHTWGTMRWIGLTALDVPELHPTGLDLLALTESSPSTPAPDPLERSLLVPALDLERPPSARWDLDRGTELAYELLDRLAQLPTASGHQPSPVEFGPDPIFRRSGDVWQLAWQGRETIIGHSKGLADLARLLAGPGRELSALDLMNGQVLEQAIDSGPDREARRRYEQRLRDLQDELDEAEAQGDRARAEMAQLEFDQILSALATGTGLAGRDRTTGGSSEKARSAVTWRIKAAIKKIDRELPELARHLRLSVKTGAWCSYDPEDRPSWVTER